MIIQSVRDRSVMKKNPRCHHHCKLHATAGPVMVTTFIFPELCNTV